MFNDLLQAQNQLIAEVLARMPTRDPTFEEWFFDTPIGPMAVIAAVLAGLSLHINWRNMRTLRETLATQQENLETAQENHRLQTIANARDQWSERAIFFNEIIDYLSNYIIYIKYLAGPQIIYKNRLESKGHIDDITNFVKIDVVLTTATKTPEYFVLRTLLLDMEQKFLTATRDARNANHNFCRQRLKSLIKSDISDNEILIEERRIIDEAQIACSHIIRDIAKDIILHQLDIVQPKIDDLFCEKDVVAQVPVLALAHERWQALINELWKLSGRLDVDPSKFSGAANANSE